ncbi:MAG: DUF433 domain-containing protein [Nodosilinea sp.]
MATITDIATLIVKSPETCGGRPRIVNTRVSVQQVATLHKQGLSPTDILAEYEFLNLAQIYAALAYYYANQSDIEAYLAEEATEYHRLVNDHRARQAE